MVVDAQRIRQRQMLDPPGGVGERPDGAVPKSERVRFVVVIVKHAKGPADDGVGVDVRRVLQRKLVRQLIADFADRFQIIQAEGVGRAQRGDDRGDLCGRP